MDALDAAAGAVLLLIAGLSARAYDHRARRYAIGKAPSRSIAHFRYIYRYLQVTTIAVVLAALVSDAPWLLEVHADPRLAVAGLVVASAGAGLFIAAKRTLGHDYSPCFDAFLPNDLVTHGVYARIRHPIYTANVAVLGGAFLATGSAWIALNTLVLAGYYLRSAALEERELIRAYPAYARYRRGTGMFLPRWRP